ncbi:MAG: copper resistance protein B [Woeseiaceae bacterium]|nr:copper resistance protein B [Woeseiaceae bacterium]
MKLIFRTISCLLSCTTVFVSEPGLADAEDDPLLVKVMIDQLERRGSGDDHEDAWDAEAWFGHDLRKLWLKTHGDRQFGATREAQLQLLYSRAVSTYWDLQAGVRHDYEPGASRSWLALGFNGLAPYFFDIDAAFFVGESGRTAVRAEAEYELLITQRLVLTPEVEVNLYGKDDAENGIGSGLSDVEAGLRLRYEIRREIAPYIGVNWSRLFGETADFARIAGRTTSDTEFVIGVRAWF